jgi:hypothetical protein
MASATVRVKMLTNVAGRPAYTSGEIVDLKADVAQAWIREGYAALVREEGVEKAVKG